MRTETCNPIGFLKLFGVGHSHPRHRSATIQAAAWFCLSALIWLAPALQADSSIIVANGNDSGAGSLRQAISDIAAGGTVTIPASVSPVTWKE